MTDPAHAEAGQAIWTALRRYARRRPELFGGTAWLVAECATPHEFAARASEPQRKTLDALLAELFEPFEERS
jgi:hypothetical protein